MLSLLFFLLPFFSPLQGSEEVRTRINYFFTQPDIRFEGAVCWRLAAPRAIFDRGGSKRCGAANSRQLTSLAPIHGVTRAADPSSTREDRGSRCFVQPVQMCPAAELNDDAPGRG